MVRSEVLLYLIQSNLLFVKESFPFVLVINGKDLI